MSRVAPPTPPRYVTARRRSFFRDARATPNLRHLDRSGPT